MTVHRDQAALFDIDAAAPEDKPPAARAGALAKKFGVPPFTTLDARSGTWRSRKTDWLALGIESELGRGDVMKAGGLYAGDSEWAGYRGPKMVGLVADGKVTPTKGKAARSFRLQSGDGGTGGGYESLPSGGTSVFDPVLCELVYRWYCPPGGRILDPFAGGSVRGIVASMLGRDYVGIDLSDTQIEANREQAIKILGERRVPDHLWPFWVEGDSLDVRDHVRDMPDFDFWFSCPPYADLEVYSDDPRDLSTMDYASFRSVFKMIVALSTTRLKTNRFAAIVVGDVRGPDGCYRMFVRDAMEAFEEAGLKLYNEAVLLTSLGSLPIRTSAQFGGNRKLGKAHQNLLIFVKGDPKLAAEACPLTSDDLIATGWATADASEPYRGDEKPVPAIVEIEHADAVSAAIVVETEPELVFENATETEVLTAVLELAHVPVALPPIEEPVVSAIPIDPWTADTVPADLPPVDDDVADDDIAAMLAQYEDDPPDPEPVPDIAAAGEHTTTKLSDDEFERKLAEIQARWANAAWKQIADDTGIPVGTKDGSFEPTRSDR